MVANFTRPPLRSFNCSANRMMSQSSSMTTDRDTASCSSDSLPGSVRVFAEMIFCVSDAMNAC